MARTTITERYVLIEMQTFDEFDCTECGRIVPADQTTTERIVFDDGTAGHRFLCLPCARKLGIDDSAPPRPRPAERREARVRC